LGEEKYPSALPFLPPLTDATISAYFQFYATACAVIIIFGGLLSPVLEVRLGIGGVLPPLNNTHAKSNVNRPAPLTSLVLHCVHPPKN
jgi:hypothetical protein